MRRGEDRGRGASGRRGGGRSIGLMGLPCADLWVRVDVEIEFMLVHCDESRHDDKQVRE